MKKSFVSSVPMFLPAIATLLGVPSCSTEAPSPPEPNNDAPHVQASADGLNLKARGVDIKLLAARHEGRVTSALVTLRGDTIASVTLADVASPRDEASRAAFEGAVEATTRMFERLSPELVRHDVVTTLGFLDRVTRMLARVEEKERVLSPERAHVGHLASIVVRAAHRAKPEVMREIPAGGEVVKYLAQVEPAAVPLAFSKETKTSATIKPKSGPGNCGGCFGAWGPNCEGSGSTCTQDPNGSWYDPSTGQSYDCHSNAISTWHDEQCCLGANLPLCGMDQSQNPCNQPGAMPHGCGNISGPNQGGGTCSQFDSCDSLCGAVGVRTQQMWPDCTCVCNETTGGEWSGGGGGWGGGGYGSGWGDDCWWWGIWCS